MPPRQGRTAASLLILFCVGLGPLVSPAADLWTSEDGDRRVSLDTALKWTSLLSHSPDDLQLFPDEESGSAMSRLRLILTATHSKWMNSEIAYEHRATFFSGDAGIGFAGNILPSEAEAYYRIRQLDWEIEEGSDFQYRHELDRALVALHPRWGEVTIGRQAIGLGRGVLFGAVDIFSPFSPLELDREWRRGVDAVRVEYRVSDTSSAELLATFDDSWDDSALLARGRGYIGNVDGELIAGKRAEDIMYGATMSTTVSDAEVHLEFALFDTAEAYADGGLFGNEHLAGKAVLGSSYTFNVGDGLTLLGEYHYNGFGIEDMEDALERLSDPVFQERFLRGDMQILGQHAIALQPSYPISDIWTGSLLVLQNPVDGSGLAAPALTCDCSPNVSLLLSCYIPWGAGPSHGQLSSQYGATPVSFFFQLNLHF